MNEIQFLDFIDKTNKASSIDEAYELLVGATSQFGFDHVAYCPISERPIVDQEWLPALLINYPDDWLKRYLSENFFDTDPVVKYALSSRLPFTWREMEKRLPLSEQEKRIMKEGSEAGLYDGIAIPIHGPFGETMIASMASSSGLDNAKEKLPYLNLLAQQFHTIASSNLLDPISNGPAISLTRREAEVLRWVATGKSNWAISEILGISEHGVDFHLRNTFRKLNVNTRISASLKAIRYGVIAL